MAATSTEEYTLVEEGKPAPDFTLRSDAGEDVSLSGLRGGTVVLYFYAQDDTLGLLPSSTPRETHGRRLESRSPREML